MAIFGAGSTWEGIDEQKDEFFRNENFVIGWDYDEAKDLYLVVAALKVGDIIYLKSSAPGSRTIRVKGIGIVIGSLSEMLFDHIYFEEPLNPQSLFIRVRWVLTEEFFIEIPDSEGRLTNVRAATFYEEYLPFEQQAIVARISPKTI